MDLTCSHAGKTAPILIKKQFVESMRDGSVVVDLAGQFFLVWYVCFNYCIIITHQKFMHINCKKEENIFVFFVPKYFKTCQF